MTDTLTLQQALLIGSLPKVMEARRFSGAPVQFWPLCLEAMAGVAGVAGAELGLLLFQTDTAWKCSAIWPGDVPARAKACSIEPCLEDLASQCIEHGSARVEITEIIDDCAEAHVIAVPMDISPSPQHCVAAFFLKDPVGDPDHVIARLQLLEDTPALYQARRMDAAAKVDTGRLATILDLLALLNEKKHFMQAAMCLCNELAARFQCDRVSLGWLERDLVRVQAISHTEKFEKKMEIVQRLETVMEEALEQDTEIICPPGHESGLITRDHQAYASSQNMAHLCSLPLRVDDEAVAILTCERSEGPFSDEEIKVMHLSCDMAARRLDTLKRFDRWFGARFASWSRDKCAKLAGVENTWWKLLGLAVTVGLAVLIFGQRTYSVEAPFSLRADDVSFVPAPFEGYIQSVHTREGDIVRKGDQLLGFDTRDLRLEEASSIANVVRYRQEGEKARAEDRPSEMLISKAMADQARARLDLIRLRLAQSVIRAPIEGVIIEGDFNDLLGAPVKKGDMLFRIASLESLSVEINVEEADVHELKVAALGEIAFTSRPELEFPVRLDRIDPIAVVKPEGNTFAANALVSGPPEEWWRPGMSGIAKVNVEKRSLLWIFTHETVDYLRLILWW
ncbi:MAG: efflux RND transporter periplasmic adaptor subunit [Planctomycetota bacterium]|nr:efflux RND transporter periplasmic adaptor subunit [Planctomycetota bacterium]